MSDFYLDFDTMDKLKENITKEEVIKKSKGVYEILVKNMRI